MKSIQQTFNKTKTRAIHTKLLLLAQINLGLCQDKIFLTKKPDKGCIKRNYKNRLGNEMRLENENMMKSSRNLVHWQNKMIIL
jgi:hypothetical protein